MTNVCVVGYGAVGPVHAMSLAMIKNVFLYGICDTDKERADKGASEYGCKAFYDFDDCLKDKNIDSIHICTPHYLHFEMIERCLEAGKQVVVEKPVTMKREEFEHLLSRHGNQPIYPVIQNRTNACVQKMKEMIDTKTGLGKLKMAKGILTWHRDEQYYAGDWWRGTKAYEGGGVLINQAFHTLDLMIYLAGNVKNAIATISNKSLQGVIEVEDTVDAFLEFENGATGLFYATNAYGKNSSPQIEFEFEKGSLRYIDNMLYYNHEFVCCDERSFCGKDYWGSGHARLFYDIYVKQKGFLLEDVKNTMRTMFTMYQKRDKQEGS